MKAQLIEFLLCFSECLLSAVAVQLLSAHWKYKSNRNCWLHITEMLDGWCDLFALSAIIWGSTFSLLFKYWKSIWSQGVDTSILLTVHIFALSNTGITNICNSCMPLMLFFTPVLLLPWEVNVHSDKCLGKMLCCLRQIVLFLFLW